MEKNIDNEIVLEGIDKKIDKLKNDQKKYNGIATYPQIKKITSIGVPISVAASPALGVWLSGRNPFTCTIPTKFGDVNIALALTTIFTVISIPATISFLKLTRESCIKTEKEKQGISNEISFYQEQKEIEKENINERNLTPFERLAIIEKNGEKAYQEGYNKEIEQKEKKPRLLKSKIKA